MKKSKGLLQQLFLLHQFIQRYRGLTCSFLFLKGSAVFNTLDTKQLLSDTDKSCKLSNQNNTHTQGRRRNSLSTHFSTAVPKKFDLISHINETKGSESIETEQARLMTNGEVAAAAPPALSSLCGTIIEA